MNATATHPEERNLLDYLYVVVKWRRLLVAGTLAAGIAAAGVSMVLPERWTARTSLLPPDEEGGSLGLSLLAGGSGVPAGLASLVGLSTPSERLLTLLDSRRLLGHVVDRYGLVAEFGALHRDNAIDLLAENVSRELAADGSLAIEVTAATPELASDLANAMGSLLDSLNRQFRQHQAQSTRTFLEQRVGQTRSDLGVDAERLRRFQKEYGIVDIEAQTSAAVDVVKGIVLQLALLQVELGVMSRTLAEDHADRNLLAVEADELEGQLQKLVGDLSYDIGEEAAGAARDRPLGPPLNALPDVMHEYAELSLQLQVREQILAFLGAKLEEAKYREALNTPTLQVLDPATPPKTRAAPRRALLTVAGAGSALILLTALAFVLEAWQRGSTTHHERMEAIRGQLRR